MSANDVQIGGSHYKQDEGAQHWDLMAEFGDGYFIGNATKYLTRHEAKNGAEDLEKAKHYLKKLGELHIDGKINPTLKLLSPKQELIGFFDQSDMTNLERDIFTRIWFWGTFPLGETIELIDELMITTYG